MNRQPVIAGLTGIHEVGLPWLAPGSVSLGIGRTAERCAQGGERRAAANHGTRWRQASSTPYAVQVTAEVRLMHPFRPGNDPEAGC
jgi:hypothetical protein